MPLHVAPLLFAASHTLPQPPQFVVVFVGVSQPLVFTPVFTQSPKPLLQEYEHVVPLHDALAALVKAHTLLQPPQFAVVLSGISQPFVFSPDVSQSPHPPLQPAYTHLPVEHVGLVLCEVSQIAVQVDVQTLGCVPVQSYAKFTAHAVQPSLAMALPSSQASVFAFLPSPQVVVQTLGCVPEQPYPKSIAQAVQPSSAIALPSSQASLLARLPSPQVEVQTLGSLPVHV